MQKSTGHEAKPQGQAPEATGATPKPKVDVLKAARLSVVAQNRLGQRPPGAANNLATQGVGTPAGPNGVKPLPGSALPPNGTARKSTSPIIVPASRRRSPRASNASNSAKTEGSSPEPTSQSRQRVRPETRLQMLERLTNPLISLHEASVLLSVCPATVRRYTAAGLLTHVRTEGQQRRFYLRDVLALMRQLESRRH
ncbi:MAG: hypothetical protein JO316_24225 [Abitibacteriaceae bacterium]|nr:hypothetical protein [Abditibacteriaceae bacterium]